jgi:CRP-like cAMP-binding protein
MVDIGRVVAGGSFGALALTDGKPRISTTKCITRVHLLVLDKAHWR